MDTPTPKTPVPLRAGEAHPPTRRRTTPPPNWIRCVLPAVVLFLALPFGTVAQKETPASTSPATFQQSDEETATSDTGLGASDQARPEPDAETPEPRGVVRVAHDLHYPPYEFISEDGVSQGFGLEVIREAAKRLGLRVEYVPLPWEEVLEALRTGKADVTPEMMHSEERHQNWYLGNAWGETWSVVFVQHGSGYERLKDLWGRKIAVPAGDIELERLGRLGGFNLIVTPNTRDALQLLDRSEVQAVGCNRDVALYELAQSPIPLGHFRVLDDPLAVTPYSVAGRQDKQYLVDSLTEAIEEMKQDGTFELLHWKWFLRPSDESIRIREQESLLRRMTFGFLVVLAVLLAVGFVYYRRQKTRLEKLVRRRTRELTLSERHYRALFDHARDAIFLLNPEDRKITEVNPSAERLTGRTRRRLIGRSIDDLFTPEERKKAHDLFEKQTREESQTLFADVTLQRPDGVQVIAQVRGAMVRLKEGTTLYAVFRDVTETAQARRQIEETNNELRIQNALAFALQHDLPLGRRLGGGLEAVLELQEFQIRKRAAILLQEPGSEHLVLAAQRGLQGLTSFEDIELAGEKPGAVASRFQVRGGLLGRALQGEMVIMESCRGELFRRATPEDVDEHGHYVCPLRSEGRILGLLCLFTEPHPVTDERRRTLIEGLCGQIGLVIESELRETALRDREHRLESLYEIAISLGSSLHLTEQLRILFAQIRRVMTADAGNVWVADNEPFTGEAEVYYSYDTREDGALVESPAHQKGQAVPGTSIHKVFTTGQPLLILRTEEEMRGLQPTDTQFGLERRSRSLLYVPLKFKGKVIGVLTVQSYRAFTYTQETVDVLMSLSAPLAAVIENARLFEDVEERRSELDRSLKMIEADLKAAQVAQESLLPREFPRIAGWDFASIFIPSQYVGGDIYNLFQLDDRHFGLYHIDVSGHGVPAALFSVGLNQYLMRDLLGPGVMRDAGEKPGQFRIRSPEEVVAALDRENMFQKHQRFFTMLYLVADVQTGAVQFYRAGHNEPLLLRQGEPPRYLSGGGPLIGFQLPRTQRECQEVQLQPGDRLVIYSDGINEAVNEDGDLYGLDRMAQFLARTDGASLQSTFNRLVQDVRKFTQSQSFEDDVSMLGLAWAPPAKP